MLRGRNSKPKVYTDFSKQMRDMRAELDEGKASAIVEHVREGNFFETACALEGVMEKTGRSILQRGRKYLEEYESDPEMFEAKYEGDTYVLLHMNFYVGIQQAMAEAESSDVKSLKDAAKKDWKAAAFRLERAHGSKWRKKDEVEVSHEHSGTVKVLFQMPRPHHGKAKEDSPSEE
jgi:transposase